MEVFRRSGVQVFRCFRVHSGARVRSGAFGCIQAFSDAFRRSGAGRFNLLELFQKNSLYLQIVSSQERLGGGMVDTRDLKSLGQQCLCGFESRPRHIKTALQIHVRRFIYKSCTKSRTKRGHLKNRRNFKGARTSSNLFEYELLIKRLFISSR